ncbi:5146_t:CDS:2 [Funneliformis caledonium]|uniref:5146_t:CDS:1 n=1 Tax=Funneliformis caledonium TaxID=1117310 RepID=A0A9N9CYE2_9GLOM|nr:5146_t:CDS:2 [Funneliformis caledonium]
MRKNLQNILIDYSPNDIFNVDKTELYWKMEPNCTLSTRSVASRKQFKEHVTVALCCNALGTEKVKAVFIGKSQNLHFNEYDEINKIQDFIDQLTSNIYKNPIPAKEYLQSEKEETIHQIITDEKIIELMKELEEEPNNEEPEISIISNYEALAALNQIIIYAEQKSDKIDFSKDQIQAVKF